MRSIESELNDHASFLRTLARRLVVDDASADDLVQDTFTSALDRPPTRTAGALPWLITTLRRRASTRRRTDARRARREHETAGPEATRDVADAAAEIELARQLLAHVEALAEPFRVALFLRYYEGLPPREIAARTGVPVATVKSRLARGLSELRERLDAQGNGGRERWLPAAAALGRVSMRATSTGLTVALQVAAAAAAVATVFVGLRALTAGLVDDEAAGAGPQIVAVAGGNAPPVTAELQQPATRQTRATIAAQSAAPLDTIEVHGRVVDDSPNGGSGAADVEVFAPGGRDRMRSTESAPTASGLVGLGYMSVPEPVERPVAYSDASGRFTVALSRDSTNEIALRVPATATHRAAVVVVEADPSATGPIELQLTRYPHGTLDGVVIDVAGVPIEGVRVARAGHQGETVELVETAVDGRFSFALCRDERTASMLKASAPGRMYVGRTRTSALPHGGWKPMTITLARTGSLEITLTDASGAAAAGCDVLIDLNRNEVNPRGQLRGANGRLTARTDENGRAVFEAVPAGLGLMLVANDGTRASAFDRERDNSALVEGSEGPGVGPIVVEAGQRYTLTAAFPEERVLSVTVVDASGQGVPDARVSLRNHGSLATPLDRVGAIRATDSGGHTQVHLNTVQGFGSLFLSATWSAEEGGQTFSAALRVDESDPPERRHTLVLEPCSPIEGTVSVPTDRVNWTSIKATAADTDSPELTSRYGSLGVDAKGQFHGILPHGRYTLVAEHPLHAPITRTIEVPTSSPINFAFVGAPDATVWIEIDAGGLDVSTVQVTVGSYRPLDGASSVQFPTLRSGRVEPSVGRPTGAATRVSGWQHHDEGGVHTTRNSVLADWKTPTAVPVRSGPGWVGVRINDSAMRYYAFACTQVVNIPGGDTHLTFEAVPTIDVRGRLVGPGRTPVRGAELCVALRDVRGRRVTLNARLRGDAGRKWRATGYQGFFSLAAIPVGTYTLEVGTSAELQANAPILVAPLTVEAGIEGVLEFEVPTRR